MSFTTTTLQMDQLAEVLVQALTGSLEEQIKGRLLKVIDPIISELARDLARKTAIHVQSFQSSPGTVDPFGPKTIQVQLRFNNKDVVYTAEGTTE